MEVGHDDRVRLVLEDVPNQLLFKGISDRATFEQVVIAALSSDGLAHVETDMRTHLNPTRMGTSFGKLGSGGLQPTSGYKGDPGVRAVWPSTRWWLFVRLGLKQAPGL
jgi:hypothetical protein